jgi:hypothetical protein
VCFFCKCNCCSAVADPSELAIWYPTFRPVTNPSRRPRRCPHCSSHLHGFSQSPPSPGLGLLRSLFLKRSTQTSVVLSRLLSTPNGLQESIPLRQSVQAVVTLSTAAHEAAERVDLVLAGVAAHLVDFADADLDRGMVFGFDDAIGGRTLAGDVAIVGKGVEVSGWVAKEGLEGGLKWWRV